MIANQRNECRFAILWHSVPPTQSPGSEGESLLGQTGGRESSEVVQVQNPLLARVSHFDLLLQPPPRNDLECGEAVLTWEVLRLPLEGEVIQVKRLADHRLIYLDFEGELSENRGHVTRWEAGHLIWDNCSANHLQALLFGERLTAKLVLEIPRHYELTNSGNDLRWNLTAEMWQVQQPS